MTTADPISLAQAQRLAANADTILLRATRPADLETPIGAFLRLDDGGPAYLLESVEGGERLGRYSFLGVGPRRLLEVRDGVARIQTRPVTVPVYAPDLPIERVAGRRPAGRHPLVRAAPPGPADRGHAALHRRRRRGAGLRRGVGLRADRAAARARPGRRADGGLHRDRPRPRLRPPDPHAVGHRLAPHRRARTSRRATGSPRRRSSRRSSGRARPSAAELAGGAAGRPTNGAGAARSGDPAETSLGRDEYIHAVEVAKDAIAAGEAIQVVLARRQSFDLPVDPATGAPLDGIGAVPRAPPGQPEPVPVLRPDADVRGRRRLARSCCSRSRATG